MKAYDGPAVLRWRANRTLAMNCDVAAIVVAPARGWVVHVVPSTQDDHWGLETFPNPWELVFPDGSAFDVDIESSGDVWTVTEVASVVDAATDGPSEAPACPAASPRKAAGVFVMRAPEPVAEAT